MKTIDSVTRDRIDAVRKTTKSAEERATCEKALAGDPEAVVKAEQIVEKVRADFARDLAETLLVARLEDIQAAAAKRGDVGTVATCDTALANRGAIVASLPEALEAHLAAVQVAS